MGTLKNNENKVLYHGLWRDDKQYEDEIKWIDIYLLPYFCNEESSQNNDEFRWWEKLKKRNRKVGLGSKLKFVFNFGFFISLDMSRYVQNKNI